TLIPGAPLPGAPGLRTYNGRITFPELFDEPPRLPRHPPPLPGPPRDRDVLSRRGPARRRGGGDGPRQSVVELLLAAPGERAVGPLPLHRAGPRGHGAVGQAG